VIVKICGITREEDARAAAEEGAAALGFIFARESPRAIAPGSAAGIIAALPPFVTPVGVFVNASREEVLATIEQTGIRCLQLHGEETPADTLGYPVPVVKAFRVGDSFDPAILGAYALPAYLLDASVPGMRGGTGRTFDWSRAEGASRYGRIILGGGITPENAALASRTVHPYALDVSSGVESSPGVKDRKKIRALFESLRDA
jgi:phosphoribosylanthranilate isomerase